jgi:transposase
VDDLSRRLVPDELWALVEPLILEPAKRPQDGGPARVDDRAVFTAIVFVLTSGCAWRHLPPSFGVTVPTAHRRFTEWTKVGLWRRLHHAVLDELGSQGMIDWSRAVLDGASVRAITADIARVDDKIEELITPSAHASSSSMRSPGSVARPAQVAIAEIGLDMDRFPTPGHLCSWAKFAPGISESAGKKKGTGGTGHGNPYLARVLGEAAVAASRTDTFLGERYRRIARHSGAKKAIVALGRSILVIIWHLLSDPTPATMTWARTSTSTTPTANARSVTTSASSTPWATESLLVADLRQRRADHRVVRHG